MLINSFKKIYLKYLRRKNQVKWAKRIGVKIGERCRLIDVSFSSEPYLVTMGDHVSATKVHFETHDGGLWVFRDNHPDWDIIRGITIGSNVYLGYGCLILPGVTIGDNVVVGANSVVTKSLASNAVYAGVPARKIKELDDYYNGCRDKAIETKQLSEHQKRDYYLKNKVF